MFCKLQQSRASTLHARTSCLIETWDLSVLLLIGVLCMDELLQTNLVDRSLSQVCVALHTHACRCLPLYVSSGVYCHHAVAPELPL